MHPKEVRHAALALVAGGVNDCEIARRLGVPRTTVRDWRAPRYEAREPRSPCARCWQSAPPSVITASDYALLLGLYLGDGCISRAGRTFRLRIHLDMKYPRIIQECQELLGRCFPAASVGTQLKDDGSCAVVGVYGNHLPCLLPQHGPGKKHERPLTLESWQESLIATDPWSLLRGLVWSDGSSFTNRTGRYEYLCFEFSNMSPFLIDLFAATCAVVGAAHRRYSPKSVGDGYRKGQVRVNRREAVALFERHVGVKR